MEDNITDVLLLLQIQRTRRRRCQLVKLKLMIQSTRNLVITEIRA